MSSSHPNNFPKLHNAAWPGVVGKGEGSEPPIDLDTMLDLTAAAEVDGVKFDGVDLFLFDPHVDIDATDDDLKALADKVRSRGPGDRLGRRPGLAADRRRLGDGRGRGPQEVPRAGPQGLPHRRDAARARRPAVRRRPHRLGLRARATGPPTPRATRRRSPRPSSRRPTIAEDHGERLAAEGEICWGGMHSWRRMVELLELVERPETRRLPGRHGPHAALHAGLQRPGRPRSCPTDFDWNDTATLDEALKKLTAALRPWTIDFHVAQNDATVFGSGSHDKTGRHCLATDPNGKLDIANHAGYWLRDENGNLTKAFRHICWDGCMFPNDVDDEAADLERHPRHDDRRPRRTTAGRNNDITLTPS